jgi:hypothetical protein
MTNAIGLDVAGLAPHLLNNCSQVLVVGLALLAAKIAG